MAGLVKAHTRTLEEELEAAAVDYRWEEQAMARKWGWTGHILRRGDSRRTAQLLKANPRAGGRRRLRGGKPRHRWDWLFLEILGDGWQEVAMDRETWRFYTDEAKGWVRHRLLRDTIGLDGRHDD